MTVKSKKVATAVETSARNVFFKTPLGAVHAMLLNSQFSEEKQKALYSQVKNAVCQILLTHSPSDTFYFDLLQKDIYKASGIKVIRISETEYSADCNISEILDIPIQSYLEHFGPHTKYPMDGVIKTLDPSVNQSIFTKKHTVFVESDSTNVLRHAQGHVGETLGLQAVEHKALEDYELSWFQEYSFVVSAGSVEKTDPERKPIPLVVRMLSAQKAASKLGFVVDTENFNFLKRQEKALEKKINWFHLQSVPFEATNPF